MVLLLCLTFVGQTLASTVMPYQMAGMMGMSGPEQSRDMSKMDRSGYSMTSDATLDTLEKSIDDCCAKNMDRCFTGGCSFFAVLIKDISQQTIRNVFLSKISYVSNLELIKTPSSLYRPPILS
tara:strand:- start:880 stop:1248 length:369 start_codon:yes stop_codon:yes gene_type:complete